MARRKADTKTAVLLKVLSVTRERLSVAQATEETAVGLTQRLQSALTVAQSAAAHRVVRGYLTHCFITVAEQGVVGLSDVHGFATAHAMSKEGHGIYRLTRQMSQKVCSTHPSLLTSNDVHSLMLQWCCAPRELSDHRLVLAGGD